VPRKLKVFRTSTGFHDAYVAAPSRKAALAAWGADADLFARGVAEQVTDPTLMTKPLERPGEVIRVSRGDLAAQLKALGPRKAAKRREVNPTARKPRPREPAGSGPPPGRDGIEAAEKALAQALKRHAAETGALERQRDAVERRLETLRARQANERARLERKRDDARQAYSEALANWSQ
jgi:hypothetical protein